MQISGGVLAILKLLPISFMHICQVLARQLFVGKFTKFLKTKASRYKDFIQKKFATAKRGVGWGLMLSLWMGSVDLWQEQEGTLLLILSTNAGYSESLLQLEGCEGVKWELGFVFFRGWEMVFCALGLGFMKKQ